MEYLTDLVILVVVLLAVFLVAPSPVFWIGLFNALLPSILQYVTKRMSPEDEAMWRDYQARGLTQNEFERDLKFKRLALKRKVENETSGPK